jgi:hypothetical protein
MLDRRREQCPRLVQAAAGKQHTLDLAAVLGPFLDLVEVAVVRVDRVVNLFVRPIIPAATQFETGRRFLEARRAAGSPDQNLSVATWGLSERVRL